jgi:hypothetical protein
MKNRNQKRGLTAQAGFIQLILLVVGALVLLKYIYHVDVVGFLTTGKSKELLDQFYDLGNKGWEKYYDTVVKVWNYIVEIIKKIYWPK